MDLLRQAAQQALEALEYRDGDGADQWKADVITAIRSTLAQPELEPVRRVQKQFMEEEVFYAAPPQRKPLTDDDIQALWEKTFESGSSPNTFARAIEAAHGIKE